MTNPGRGHCCYVDGLDSCDQLWEHKKIEAPHTDSRCCYKRQTSIRGDQYYLIRDCYCDKFTDDVKEKHYSFQCHYMARRDTQTGYVYLILKCKCQAVNLIRRTPDRWCVVM